MSKLSAVAALLLAAAAAAGQAAPAKAARSSEAAEKYWPPWNAPPANGVNFTVPRIDNVPDLHGDIVDPQLVVLFAGNQFMATEELMREFRQAHPEVQRIFWETLPPGILAKQIEQGALIIGNLRIAIQPDLYTAGARRIEPMEQQGRFSRVETYARGRLAIMVARGNPKQVRSLKDLGRPEVRVAMPNPEWEGVASQIIASYKKAGGEALADRIMKAKVADGSTYLTRIHHRETPLRIMLGESDAGVVWYTEAKFQEAIGNPIESVEIPAAENTVGTYMAGVLKNAPHEAAARAFFDFLTGAQGQAILRKYGFLAPKE